MKNEGSYLMHVCLLTDCCTGFMLFTYKKGWGKVYSVLNGNFHYYFQ